jgi:hypothetical protein
METVTNDAALIDAIVMDAMRQARHAKNHCSPLDAMTALALLTRQALELFASQRPRPAQTDAQFVVAERELRSQLPDEAADAPLALIMQKAADKLGRQAAMLRSQNAVITNLRKTLREPQHGNSDQEIVVVREEGAQ